MRGLYDHVADLWQTAECLLFSGRVGFILNFLGTDLPSGPVGRQAKFYVCVNICDAMGAGS